MTTEMKPAWLRTIDMDKVRQEMEANGVNMKQDRVEPIKEWHSPESVDK